MLAPKCTTQPNVRCWVWFKGNPLKHEGCWKGGMELSLFWGGGPYRALGRFDLPFPQWKLVFTEPARHGKLSIHSRRRTMEALPK